MKYVQVGLGQRWGGLRRILDQYPGFERQATVLLNGRMARDGIYTDLATCLADQRADVVISFASPLATPGLAKTALDCGVPIMVTAPPAATTAGLDELGEFADTNQVQVYQPYVRLPGHLARLAALRLGHLGAVSEVQIGLDEPAHAIALMRAYLWAASDAAEGRRAVVSGHDFPSDELDRTDERPPSLSAIDFGEGKRGIYLGKGTKAQPGRLLIKAGLGEISGDQVVSWQDNLITTTYLQRRQFAEPAGQGADQFWLGDQLLWSRTPRGDWRPSSDEEIAAASVLDSLVRWLRGEGPDPHPLAEALWEARLGLAVSQTAHDDQEITLDWSH